MKLNRTICIDPATQSLVFGLNRPEDMAIAIMAYCAPEWAEAAPWDGSQAKRIRTTNDLQKTIASGVSSFTCRVASPDGIGARITIDFRLSAMCLTCTPGSAEEILAPLLSETSQTAGSSMKTKQARQPRHYVHRALVSEAMA